MKIVNIKLVIIQSDPFEADATARSFNSLGCTVVGIGTSGKEAVELVCSLKPDVLVMEPFLPALNCDDIAALLEQKCSFPLVKLVLSTCKNDLMAERFLNSGGDLFLLTPVDFKFCLSKLEKYLKVRQRHAASKEAVCGDAGIIHRCTQKYQTRMKMSMTINGFLYLQDAVELALSNRGMLQAITTRLYPMIAQRHQVSPSCVELNIRTAIELTFERGDLAFLYEYFGSSVREASGKPTNSEFIAGLTELVRNDLEYELA